MDLLQQLENIKRSLRFGLYRNEQSVTQGILLPLLHILGWPVFEPQIVYPEYNINGKRVDFALCHHQQKPMVFIEVKRVGKLEEGFLQLLNYAFEEGVPIAVLTDGQNWHFFLPGMQGKFEDRCIYKLDILERDLKESSTRLQRYLEYTRVRNGEAFKAAKEDYDSNARKAEIRKTLPLAWKKLLNEPDEIVIDLLAETVADICGYTPDKDLLVSFLRQHISTHISPPLSPPCPPESPIKKYGFILKGEEYSANSKRDVLIKLLNKLYELDNDFIERFKAREHGRKRRYVATTRDELYPDRPDLCNDQAVQLQSGDWAGVNYSGDNILKIIKLASDVANLASNTDLVVFLGK